jgi:hypothetical protein
MIYYFVITFCILLALCIVSKPSFMMADSITGPVFSWKLAILYSFSMAILIGVSIICGKKYYDSNALQNSDTAASGSSTASEPPPEPPIAKADMTALDISASDSSFELPAEKRFEHVVELPSTIRPFSM